MAPRTRIALRLLGFALLIFAGVRFVIAVASSSSSEGPISQAKGGGFQIDQIIEIDPWMLFAGFLGMVAVLASVAARRGKAHYGQI